MLFAHRRSNTKLVPPEDSAVEVLEESNQVEKPEELMLMELDYTIECPRCHEIMELQSSFDKLMYTCESCSFLLKCV